MPTIASLPARLVKSARLSAGGNIGSTRNRKPLVRYWPISSASSGRSEVESWRSLTSRTEPAPVRAATWRASRRAGPMFVPPRNETDHGVSFLSSGLEVPKKRSIGRISSPLVPGGNSSYVCSSNATRPRRWSLFASVRISVLSRWLARGSTLAERSMTRMPLPPCAK